MTTGKMPAAGEVAPEFELPDSAGVPAIVEARDPELPKLVPLTSASAFRLLIA